MKLQQRQLKIEHRHIDLGQERRDALSEHATAPHWVPATVAPVLGPGDVGEITYVNSTLSRVGQITGTYGDRSCNIRSLLLGWNNDPTTHDELNRSEIQNI